MISNFVCPPKFACKYFSWIETGPYLAGSIYCSCYWKISKHSSKLEERRKERVFFFFFEVPSSPYRIAGGPKRCTGCPRPIKCPLWLILAHLIPPSHSRSLQKFLEWSWSQWTNLFVFSPPFQSAASIYSALEVSVHFSSSLFFFFCKMLVAILLEMHASVYFIFGIFISIYFCHDLCQVILGKMHVCIFVFDIWMQICGKLDV